MGLRADEVERREYVRAVLEAEWEHFKAHWPLHVWQVLVEMGGGFIFGLALGAAAVVAALEQVA